MQKWEYEERRSVVRFPVTIDSIYSELSSSREGWGKTFDISSRGVCLQINEELPLGSNLNIWLKMPDNGEKIKVLGRIVWHSIVGSEKHRVGLALENKPELKPIPLVLRTIRF